MEARYQWSYRQERGSARLQAIQSLSMEMVERVSPTIPCRNQMNCVKRLGQGIMTREFGRQVAELQIRTSVLNCFTALGTPETITVMRT